MITWFAYEYCTDIAATRDFYHDLVEQFGGAGEIPVGVAGFGVTEPGRQDREHDGGVVPTTICLDHGRDGEGVPKVVQPGPTG